MRGDNGKLFVLTIRVQPRRNLMREESAHDDEIIFLPYEANFYIGEYDVQNMLWLIRSALYEAIKLVRKITH
jgi:hypothetical protein